MLKATVAARGPVSVGICVSQHFMNYKNGIFIDDGCGPIIDHGVLVVGYGVDNKTNEEYWLVKNSWGTDWGEQGYIRMARNRSNMCNIASDASFPVI